MVGSHFGSSQFQRDSIQGIVRLSRALQYKGGETQGQGKAKRGKPVAKTREE